MRKRREEKREEDRDSDRMMTVIASCCTCLDQQLEAWQAK